VTLTITHPQQPGWEELILLGEISPTSLAYIVSKAKPLYKETFNGRGKSISFDWGTSKRHKVEKERAEQKRAREISDSLRIGEKYNTVNKCTSLLLVLR
jgi:hypothetical protein